MKDLIDRLRHRRPPSIVVIGDVMLDQYTWGCAGRVSPEAPVPILRAEQHEARLGGAASVATLLRALSANVLLFGICGDDREAQILSQLLAEQQIVDAGLLRDPSRPTTSKHRFMGLADARHAHQMLRVDHESTRAIDEHQQDQLLRKLTEALPQCAAVLVSDYGKGVCTARLMHAVIRQARSLNLPVLVDPARAASDLCYAGATLLKPNRHEAERAACITITTPSDAIEAARRIRERHNVGIVVVTLDRDGMVLVDGTELHGLHMPSRAREVYDITGAGDMALAAMGLAIAASESAERAVGFANLAAGIEVENPGIVPVSWDELEREANRSQGSRTKVLQLNELVLKIKEHRLRGQSTVFTNGCFDLLHVGHVNYLEQAAALGDVLIVAINSDASVRRLKGESRPIICQQQRAAMLAALSCATYVIVFDEDTPHRLLELLRPDVLVKGGNYTPDQIVGREVVQRYNAAALALGHVPAVSTTSIVERIQSTLAATGRENSQ